MNKKFKILIIILVVGLIALLIFGCSENESIISTDSIGNEILDNNQLCAKIFVLEKDIIKHYRFNYHAVEYIEINNIIFKNYIWYDSSNVYSVLHSFKPTQFRKGSMEDLNKNCD